MTKQKIKLNSKHYRLYDLLSNVKWMTSKDIANALPEHYSVDEATVFENTVAREIRKDVARLNDSDKFNQIIISHTKKGYKKATADEFYVFVSQRRRTIFSSLKRLTNLHKKAKLNGQLKLLIGKYEKQFYEVFKKMQGELAHGKN